MPKKTRGQTGRSPIEDDRRYLDFLARDRSFDGKFLTGVVTTGIYCLPSCPARRPKRENVRFFDTLEEARRSGLRPCHRCRPDWFYRGEDWYETLYEQTIARVRESPSDFPDIGAVARLAGISRTALNELFHDHGHESPAMFLRRARIEHAQRALERGESLLNAAAAAGFESHSTFHQQFCLRTGMTPGAYADLGGRQEFSLRLPAGYRTEEVLRFYGRDPLSISERVTARGVDKALMIDGKAAVIAITFDRGTAYVRTDTANAFAAHRVAVRMTGIDSEAGVFERIFVEDSLLGALIQKQKGLRIPLTPEPWEALAWAIIGQQISVKAAVALRRELIANVGVRHSSGLITHPTFQSVASLQSEVLRGLKFSTSKAEYLLHAARALCSGQLPLDGLHTWSKRHAARALADVHGIGPWTIQYLFLRGFGFSDCVPAGDAGLAQGLEKLTGHRPDIAGVREQMGRYCPYRSFATYHLWASLKEGTTRADGTVREQSPWRPPDGAGHKDDLSNRFATRANTQEEGIHAN